MSLQKAATILNVLQNNLTVLAVADDLQIDPVQFLIGVLLRSGLPITEVEPMKPVMTYLVGVIKQP